MTASPPLPLRPDLKSQFLLDPDLAFLNHGSFGALPRAVLEEQHDWQRRIERDPVQMLHRQWPDLLTRSKTAAGRWLGMEPSDFGLVTNATEGVNCVLRSLAFSPGDELVTTNHVYNAVRQAMRGVADRAGATYREIDVPVPVASANQIVDRVMEGISPRTRLLVIDHITSSTALVFPVEQILAACARQQIDVLVDGAHAPGMIDLNIATLSPAYYAGNLHKWGCSPRGSAFLWVRPDRQKSIHPAVISHHLGRGFAREFSWQGTRDISSWLTIPRAIEWMADIGWDRIRQYNHALAVWANQMLCQRWSVTSLSPEDGTMLGSMAAVPLPAPLSTLAAEAAEDLGRRLYDEYRVEVPIMAWNGRNYVRPCCQIYNVGDDYLRLAAAVEKLCGR